MSGTDILMYHSIGEGAGPISMAPPIFRMQMDVLADTGRRGIALREYVQAAQTGNLPEDVTVLTFDDGYQDFADVVVPELERRGWRATVFLPSGLVGSRDWNPDGKGARQLVEWNEARTFERRGVEIGAHSVTHADLTTLEWDRARREIRDCRTAIEDRADCRVTSFAAPYGNTTPAIRQEIASHYNAAVGAQLAQATPESDRYDLPRIEMWYFQTAANWRAYLDGSRAYITARRMLRGARSAAGLSHGKHRVRE